MLAYKVFMVCSMIVVFGCVGLMVLGYVKAVDDALESIKRIIDR